MYDQPLRVLTSKSLLGARFQNEVIKKFDEECIEISSFISDIAIASKETRPTVKVGQYKLRRGPVHQGVKDSIPLSF